MHTMGTIHTKQGGARAAGDPTYKAGEAPAPKVTFTEVELRAKLTEEEYSVTQGKGMCKLSCYHHISFVSTTRH